SRSTRFLRRMSSGFSGRSASAIASAPWRKGDLEEAPIVAAIHASRLFDSHLLAEGSGRSFDEAFGEGTQASAGSVAHEQHVLCRRVELEHRYVGPGIDPANLRVDDIVEGEEERER